MSTVTETSFTSTEKGFYNLNVTEQKSQLEKAKEFDYSKDVEQLRQTFKSGKTKALPWRKQQLRQIQQLIKDNYETLAQAIVSDYSGPKIRAFAELGAFNEAQDAIDNLDSWAAPEIVSHKTLNPLDQLNGKSYIRKEPKGVVLLLAPWNYPIAMVLDCLIPIIAAGNCCVIKPSEVSVNSCSTLADLLPKYLDNNAFKVITGGVPETTALLREKFDHIFYTGNGSVARIILAAAAKHLTPTTLELGGKSPVYVDKSAKLETTVARIGTGKWMNCGQTCVAPDYILAHEEIADRLTELLKEQVVKHWGKDFAQRVSNSSYGRIINERHVARVDRLLKGTKGKVLVGGKSESNEKFVEPTLIEGPGMDEPMMQEEIFGPVLPIIRVKSVSEAAKRVNEICAKPLALYVFAEDQKAVDYFIDNTTSGGVSVNTTVEHLTNNKLPFGDVGESGMGSYHGKHGFDELSHKRAVFVKDTFFQRGGLLPPPPYSDKMFDIVVKLTITGFLDDTQRKIAKYGGTALMAYGAYKLFQKFTS